MAEQKNWAFPAEMRPQPEDWRFDLDRALDAVVQLRAEIPRTRSPPRSSAPSAPATAW